MFSNRTNWKLTRNRLTEALGRAKARGISINDLTISNPTRAGLKYDAAGILRSLGTAESLDYDPQPKGLRAARESVALYYQDAHAVKVELENVILTTSTSEGYSFIFRLLANPDDEILVPKPSYPLFEFLADLCDVKLVAYPLLYDHGWQVDFHSLENAVTPRTRGVVVVHPNNPTGSFVHDDERGELNRICREHSLAIIADEVFLDYAHEGKERRTFAANQGALTFTLSGVSKIAALPQMKVAWIAASGPPPTVSGALSRLEIIADTYLSMNTPVQWATPVLLDQRKGIQRQLLDRVQANLNELDRQLERQKTCERLDVEGGWYAVLRVPVTQSDEELAVELLERRKVLVHPGHFYDFASDGYLILSLITTPEEFRDGVKGILDHLGERVL